MTVYQAGNQWLTDWVLVMVTGLAGQVYSIAVKCSKIVSFPANLKRCLCCCFVVANYFLKWFRLTCVYSRVAYM